MATLADVFQVLAEMRSAGVVCEYAVGGATAVLFYAEPARTYDLDVFVLLPPGESSLSPPQFLPAHNLLAEEAVAGARELDYEGVTVRVIDPEHLAALALQAGGARRRERAWQLLEAGAIERSRLRALLQRHGIPAELPDDA